MAKYVHLCVFLIYLHSFVENPGTSGVQISRKRRDEPEEGKEPTLEELEKQFEVLQTNLKKMEKKANQTKETVQSPQTDNPGTITTDKPGDDSSFKQRLENIESEMVSLNLSVEEINRQLDNLTAARTNELSAEKLATMISSLTSVVARINAKLNPDKNTQSLGDKAEEKTENRSEQELQDTQTAPASNTDSGTPAPTQGTHTSLDTSTGTSTSSDNTVPSTTISPVSSLQKDEKDEKPTDSHEVRSPSGVTVVVYLLISIIILMTTYIVCQNRQKIKTMMCAKTNDENRSDIKYERLKKDDEKSMSRVEKSTTPSKYIY